jgi:hypothetical protein
LLSLASATYFEIVSDALKGTSSDFGQLVVQRHFSSGIDCAMAGAATVVDAANPAPAVCRNSRRFMAYPPFGFLLRDRQPVAILHGVALTAIVSFFT